MKLRRTTSIGSVADVQSARGCRACLSRGRGACGFTLAEVLAALVFMAIVIPVTLQAVRVASQAGQVGERKAEAARIADRVLSESLATGTLMTGMQSGVVNEGTRNYPWQLSTEPWNEGSVSMNKVSVRVTYQVQGREHDVVLSTLVDPAQFSGVTTPSGTGATP